MKAEQKYWRHVIERMNGAVCALAERGFLFRRDNEQFWFSNNGNYLNLLELVANFDPFLLVYINHYGNSDQEIPLICQKLFAKR